MVGFITSALASKSLPLILGGIQLGGGIARNILAGRDEDRFRREVEQQQKQSNLIAALSRGRINTPITAQPRQSFLTKAAGAVSDVAGIGGTLLSLGQQGAQFAQQREQGQLALEAARNQQAVDTGRAEAAFGALPQVRPLPARAAIGQTLQPGSGRIGLQAQPSVPQTAQPARTTLGARPASTDLFRALGRQQGQTQQRQTALDELLRRNADTRAQEQLDLSGELGRANVAVAEANLEQTKRRTDLMFDQFKIDKLIQERKNEAQIEADAFQFEDARASFISGRVTDLGKLDITKNIGPTINAGSRALASLMQKKADGTLTGGAGLFLINATQQLADPNATVREGDVELMKTIPSRLTQIKAEFNKIGADELVPKELVAALEEAVIVTLAEQATIAKVGVDRFAANFSALNARYQIENYDSFTGLDQALSIARRGLETNPAILKSYSDRAVAGDVHSARVLRVLNF